MCRAPAEEAMRLLNVSKLRHKNIRVSWAWGRRVANKQGEWNSEYHGKYEVSVLNYGWCNEDPNMHGFHHVYAYYQQQQPW